MKVNICIYYFDASRRGLLIEYLGPYQKSMMELFAKSWKYLLVENSYFRKK